MGESKSAEDAVPSPGVHVPPPFFFVAAFLGGMALNSWRPWRLLPEAARSVGVVGGWALVSLASVPALWALATFFRARTAIMPNRAASRLVREGPYRFTRNPMYLSLSALYVGLGFLVNAAWPLALLPLPLLVLQRFIIPREERYLASRFGEEYDEFRAKVRRWI